jgi:Transposase DDE domain
MPKWIFKHQERPPQNWSLTGYNSGWISEKKEFIKLHKIVDEKSKKVTSFRITKGNVHDTKKFAALTKEPAEKYDIDTKYMQTRLTTTGRTSIY